MMFEDRCRSFETREGTPTITFESDDRQIMLPWHAFLCAKLSSEGNEILVEFQGVTVAILGHSLGELWESLRSQDTSKIFPSADPNKAECTIDAITIAEQE